MRGLKGAAIAAAVLYLASITQIAFVKWTLLGAHAEFMLLALAGLCLFTSRLGGAAIGFADGWLYAALDGANMWQYVLTRTLVGYGISAIAEMGVERNLLTAFVAAFLVVLACQLSFMFLAPPPQITPFLADTIRTAVYNGVLAMPFYAVLNRTMGQKR